MNTIRNTNKDYLNIQWPVTQIVRSKTIYYNIIFLAVVILNGRLETLKEECPPKR